MAEKTSFPFPMDIWVLNAFQQKTDNIVSSIEISDLFLIIQCPIVCYVTDTVLELFLEKVCF